MAEETNKEQPNPVGRPSKYTPAMPDRLKDYVVRGYKGDGDVIPTQAGFAVAVEVCEKTLDNWGKENPEFLQMLDYLRARQHQLLMNKGLTGEYNSTIGKLLLCSDHGHKERNDFTSDDKPLIPQIVTFCDAMNAVQAKLEPLAETPEQQ